MRIPLKALGLAAMVLLFGQQGFAKDLYVAPAGSDAVTYANNSITAPWATPVKAWAEAQAGDTVYFRGGTYLLGVIYTDGNGEIQTVGVFTRLVGNHGTAEHPIRFASYPGELATFDCRDVYTGILIAKAYHIIDRIRFVNHAVGIAAGYWGGDHLTVKNCEGVANRFGDNIGFVKIETTLAEGGVIQNNHLTGPGTYTPIGGAAGVYFRQVQRIRILNNHIRNYQKGLFMKHPNYLLDNPGRDSDIEIAHNYIEDCASAISFNGCYARIHNNLLGPRNGGIMFGEDGGFWPNISSLADYNLVEHNTIFLDPTVPFGITTPVIEMIQFGRDPGWGDPYPGSTHNVFRNNIMGGRLMSHYYGAGLSYNNTYDYNLYHNRAGDGGHYAIAAEHRVEYATLAAWGAHTGGDQHSTQGNPLYGGGANPATIAGFALAVGSPGKNAGSDGKDMGADVSRVGIQPLTSLTITSPNGGEAWRRGESRPITWTSSGVTGNVVIELVQNGTAVGIIAESVAATAGSFAWTVGRLANGTVTTGTGCKVRIRATSGPAHGEAPSRFL